MSRKTVLLAALAASPLVMAADPPDRLAKPFRLQAEGRPIDVEIGHAAPTLCDLDGDGRRDLLVGQFGGGKLRVYRNTGTDKAPAFASFDWFKAGGKVASVPYG